MKNKIIKRIFAIAMVITMVRAAPINLDATEKTVTIASQFPDQVFQNKVRKILGVDTVEAEVPISKFEEIEELKCVDQDCSSSVESLEGIEIFKNLKKLYLNNNKLKSLPESIGELTNLQYLEFEGNELESLPESIGKLSNLEYLEIFKSQLTVLPESIGKLSSLKRLRLMYNQLTSVPQSIGELSKLEYLYLSNNQLTNITESIGELTLLKMLFLHNNQLTSIPENIQKLRPKWLTLHNNQLTSLPEGVLNFDVLADNHLRHNSFADITMQEIEKKGLKQSNFLDQYYPQSKVGASGYNYKMKMSTLMQSSKEIIFDVKNYESVENVSLYSLGADESGHVSYQEVIQTETIEIDWETKEMLVPKELLTNAGQYELRFGSFEFSGKKAGFTYIFNIEDIDLTFAGMPASVTVGETFELTPSINDKNGSDGWEWDKAFFDATFNSPATFTAKKAGKTSIKYTTTEGYEIQTEVIVKETPKLTIEASQDFVKIGSTLDLSVVSNYPEVMNLAWESSDEDVATISKEGSVFGKKKGTVTITITDLTKNVVATKSIQVVDMNMDVLKHIPDAVNLNDSINLDKNLDSKEAWSWDETYFQLDKTKSLNLIAIKAGEGSIAYTESDGVKKTKQVTIRSLHVKEQNPEVERKEKLQLTLEKSHEDLKNLQWTTSNDTVVSVDQQGVVTALKEGVAEIVVIDAVYQTRAKTIVKVKVTAKPTSGTEGVPGVSKQGNAQSIATGDANERTVFLFILLFTLGIMGYTSKKWKRKNG